MARKIKLKLTKADLTPDKTLWDGFDEGDLIMVTDPRLPSYGDVLYCVGFSPHGFILLNRRKKRKIIVNTYAGRKQVEMFEKGDKSDAT